MLGFSQLGNAVGSGITAKLATCHFPLLSEAHGLDLGKMTASSALLPFNRGESETSFRKDGLVAWPALQLDCQSIISCLPNAVATSNCSARPFDAALLGDGMVRLQRTVHALRLLRAARWRQDREDALGKEGVADGCSPATPYVRHCPLAAYHMAFSV